MPRKTKTTDNLKQNKKSTKSKPKTKQEKKVKDDRMIADYFRELKKYYEKYGEATILLWQCGSFYEVYAVEHPETKEWHQFESDLPDDIVEVLNKWDRYAASSTKVK